VAKFGKDPIYRTKVIVRKRVWTPAARHTQSHNTARELLPSPGVRRPSIVNMKNPVTILPISATDKPRG
jgi:hypothetical protein